MASGALTATSENPEVIKTFKDGEELIVYRYGEWELLREKLVKYLHDEGALKKVASSGRDAVMKGHTWDHRIDALLKMLSELVSLKKELLD